MSMAAGARFSDPAELYDLVHQVKDYQGDAARLVGLLDELGVPRGGRVLEGACGTGGYLAPLAPTYAVSGFDLSPEMIGVARARLPETELFTADLADFEVDLPFDAVVVLFGGLAYVPPERLGDAAARLFAATRPGGAAVVEPWVGPDAFIPEEPHMAVFDTRWLKVCRQCVTKRDGDRAVIDFHWLVARPGFDVEHIVEPNALWLYEPRVMAEALEAVGFHVDERSPGFMDDSVLLACRRPA